VPRGSRFVFTLHLDKKGLAEASTGRKSEAIT
jgi:hypothetical protein